MDSGDRLPGFKFQLCQVLAVLPWVIYKISLNSLGMRMFTLQGCCKNLEILYRMHSLASADGYLEEAATMVGRSHLSSSVSL